MFLWKSSQPFKLLVTLMFLIIVITIGPSKVVEQEIDEIQPKIAKLVDQKQLACLAKNIFYEAGNEPLMGQAAVARVVMNRISHGFGKNPCAVIYQAHTINKLVDDEIQKVKLCQFSWVCEDKVEPNKNSARYKQAEKVAYDVLAYDEYQDVVPETTLFFHNLHVDPLWPYKQVAKIGNHIFYSKQKKQAKTNAQKI
jgi:spore germination cell wall hydrolase CwlJ-like protein